MRCVLAFAVALALAPRVGANAVCKKLNGYGSDRNLLWTTKDECLSLVPYMQAAYPKLAVGLTCAEFPVSAWNGKGYDPKGFMLAFSSTTTAAIATAFGEELDDDLKTAGWKLRSMLAERRENGGNIFIRSWSGNISPADCAQLPSEMEKLLASNIPGVFGTTADTCSSRCWPSLPLQIL